MDTRFQVALENALLYAHQLMRQVGCVLESVLAETSRDTRTELTHKLRLAEHFLRRAIALLAGDMASDLPPPRPVRAALSTQRKPTPRALALVEPPVRFSSAGPMPAGVFDSLSPEDAVPVGALARRLARLQATLANPIASARRLAFWRRRQTRRCILRPRLTLPRPVGEAARHFWDWLRTIDTDAREALRLEPG